MMVLSEKQQQARLSRALDGATVVVVVFMLVQWARDMHAGSPQHLSPSFFTHGFCNSPTMNTQKICAIFDFCCGLALVGCAFVLGGNDSSWNKRAFGAAAYLLSHGYGHYNGAKPGYLETESDFHDIIVLSALLSIGPFSNARWVKNKRWLYLGASVAVTALSAIYALYLRKAKFALLYINISILLSRCFPMALWVGATEPEHIAIRVDAYPWFYSHMLSRIFTLTLVLIEPFGCDSFYAQLGGHFWFDLALLVDVVIDLANAAEVCKRQDKEHNKIKIS